MHTAPKMESTLISTAFILLVMSHQALSTRHSSAYCCPDGGTATIQRVENRTRVVRFTQLVKTGQIIVGYKKSANCKAGMTENVHNSTLPVMNTTTALPRLNTSEPQIVQQNIQQMNNQSVVKQFLKRFWIFGRNKKTGDIVLKSTCPVYKDIMEPILAYKHENFEVPVHEAGCSRSEQICCEGYVRTSTNECHNEHDAKALENPNVKNVLGFLG